MLEDTSERRILTTKNKGTVYMDIQLGLFLVRGDSMVLLGEVDDSINATTTSLSEQNGGNENNVTARMSNMNIGLMSMNQNNINTATMRKVGSDEFEQLLQEEDEEDYKKALLKWDFDTDLAV